jgi:F-type H+-transporting ATPase subunit delta
VSSANHASGIVSERYANALIELAEEAKKLEKVEQDLKDLQVMMKESPELLGVIRSPVLSSTVLSNAMDAIADKAKFDDVTKKFIKVLINNRRLPALGYIADAFTKALATRRGAITVEVQVAQDLTAEQKKELQDALSKAMNADVTVRAKVEPSILGRHDRYGRLAHDR